jgi:hypothetical protein
VAAAVIVGGVLLGRRTAARPSRPRARHRKPAVS